MRTLYKAIKGRTKYWEAWKRNTKIIVHTGWLGHWGKQQLHAIERGESELKALTRLAAPAIAEGYAPISDDDRKMVVIQKQLESWGTAGDLDTRTQIEDVANEWLGWTGNGYSDGGDIGSGTINVFCFVVDPVLAVKTLALELKRAKLLDDTITIAYSRTAAMSKMTIGWPAHSRRRFSIFGAPAQPSTTRTTQRATTKQRGKQRSTTGTERGKQRSTKGTQRGKQRATKGTQRVKKRSTTGTRRAKQRSANKPAKH